MRINGAGGIDPIKAYQAQQKAKSANMEKKSGEVRGDTLELSPEAKKIQSYLARLEKTPEVREDLVASLKKQIAEGTYSPDAKKIASGIIEEVIGEIMLNKGGKIDE